MLPTFTRAAGLRTLIFGVHDELLPTDQGEENKNHLRKITGQYVLTWKQQVSQIQNLSDGQKCQVCLAWLAWQNPHMLFPGKPTNHLDIETIDTLADATNDFEGGMCCSAMIPDAFSRQHQKMWVCEKQTIPMWPPDILVYKETLSPSWWARNSSSPEEPTI